MNGPPDTRLAPPARILIVDDEPFNVDYLEQELECHGFVTESAGNGLEALDRIAAHPPDLVLLDVMMPGMDGISALRILKEDPETRLIPVVLMTALNAVEDRVRGIEAGADDFLSKPVDDRELLARIRTALAHKRAVDETVGELRSTSAYLERYGMQEREVAVLAVAWRPRDPSLPDEAAGFLARSGRADAEERIRAFGGTLSEREGSVLVAVFDGAEEQARSIAAVEAAFAVVDPASREVVVRAAVSVGSARVGSARSSAPAGARWLYAAEGRPVERATELVGGAVEGGIVLSGDAAAAVSDRFVLEPVDEGAFRVLGPTRAEEHAAPAPHERRVRTILVTDIVGSTRTIERVGDRTWVELIAAHERATRSELVLYGGEEIDTTGDGFFASFDSPARAIRCALALLDRLAALGLTIRAGVHTGEVELPDGRARGIALHVANRIAAKAGPGEVLVSATTRELAAGSGLGFADRGTHVLKGVSEPRRLYAAVGAVDEDAPAGPQSRPRPGSGPAYPAGLTEREVDVLRLAALGLSDAEAAAQLFVSVRTVNAHLRSIYRKVGVRSRAAAGRFAEENGLI
jgi:DNA-binding NarL/FixJ family response regulator